MAEANKTSYDEILYTDNSFAETHPDRLAAAATLFGLAPPPLEGCRVLELGCGTGGNLIPMAASLPSASFLGIDLSARQVAEGEKTTALLRLGNINLRHQSILDFGADEGSFDYIICHGVYSWVPDVVRDKILAITARHLSPQGVAYISYNTYPGWHMRGMVRDVMLYHAARFPEPAERVEQARAFLGFLSQAVSKKKGAYAQLLQDEVDLLSETPDTYLFHEHLEEHNHPVYFHQFAAQLAEHGLAFLGESGLHQNWASGFAPEVVAVLERISIDPIHAQQYMDFLRNTGFRRTLVCHAAVAIDRDLKPERLARLRVATHACPVDGEPDLVSKAVVKFESRHGNLATDEPILKAAIICLADAWPDSIPMSRLPGLARARLAGLQNGGTNPVAPPDDQVLARDRELVGQMLASATRSAEVFEWRSAPASFTTEVTNRPVACPLVRYKLTQGTRITNRLHRTIDIGDPVTRYVLIHLDGTRDRTMLLDDLCARAAAGKLIMKREDEPVTDPVELRDMLSRSLDKILTGVAQSAVLIA